MATKEQKIKNYQQGAADSLKIQRKQEAAGNKGGAELARQSVNANLDAINDLKKGRR